jgi:hypothetical protein
MFINPFSNTSVLDESRRKARSTISSLHRHTSIDNANILLFNCPEGVLTPEQKNAKNNPLVLALE